MFWHTDFRYISATTATAPASDKTMSGNVHVCVCALVTVLGFVVAIG